MPAETILLSIVTINLNNAAGLARTINSLKQLINHSEVELIFIDGASIDESVTMARHFYAAENLISEADTGIYNAMNKGLNRSTGKYIMWLNSGDELMPDFWSIIKKFLVESSAAILTFGLETWDEKGEYIVSSRTFGPESLQLGTLSHPSSIFLKSAVKNMGGYNESYKIAADKHLFISLYKNGYIFDFPSFIISKFYLGGASSKKLETYIESRRVEFEHSLIGRFKFYYLIYKFRIYSLIFKD